MAPAQHSPQTISKTSATAITMLLLDNCVGVVEGTKTFAVNWLINIYANIKHVNTWIV